MTNSCYFDAHIDVIRALTGSKALQSFNGNERDTGNPLAQQANQRGFDSKAGLEGSYGYRVPDAVQRVIGGASTGGATLTAPIQTPTEGPLKSGKPHTYTVTGPNGAIITETSDVVAPPVALPLNQPSTPTTPQEPARAPHRRPPHRVRPLSMSGLPSSLSTLRPASLPMPSAMPARLGVAPASTSAHGHGHGEKTDERARSQAIRDTMLGAFADGEAKRHVMDDVPEEPEDEVTEREAEILKLVAASMPSHRSAWKRDSGAWRTFIGRQKGKDAEKSTTSEEDEDTSSGNGAAYYDESEDESEEEPRGAYRALAIVFLKHD